MLEPAEIVERAEAFFSSGLLAGLKVLVTAGPTREAIDPVRFLSNGSSGKMGYALAEAAREAGADVTLVSGPVSLSAPVGVTCLPVTSAQDMLSEVMRNVAECDIFLAVAAVADYRCAQIADQKLPKKDQSMSLALERNPDIAASVAQLAKRPFIVGFAAETHDVIAHANAKRKQKGMDLIIANCVGDGIGMYSDENAVTVLGEQLNLSFPLMSKKELAKQLITMMTEEYRKYHDRQTCAA